MPANQRRCREERTEEPVKVYARWAGYVGARARDAKPSERRAHAYSATILPEEPLELGRKVRILATTPAWYSSPMEDPDSYDAYDTHIVGRISGIVGWKGRKIVLEIANECAVNTVKLARIRIPFVPEVTMKIGCEHLPEGWQEAQEADLNTTAVVRLPPDDASCGADTCWTPWRRLVGDAFLWEPMLEEVSEPKGARRGRKKVPTLLVGWKGAVGEDAEEGERVKRWRDEH